MKFLYIFPHPDDESFGPAAAIHRQKQAGHEVHLYTQTRGGATSQRHKLNLSVEEMGQVRYEEMKKVEQVLGLDGMHVADLPDSGLADMDPREIERAVRAEIERVDPDVIVTYPVYGVSGFHDHLVAHAVVKRVFLEMQEERPDRVRRLAFLAMPDDEEASVFLENGFRIRQSPPHRIDCVFALREADRDAMRAALQCYETYQGKIEESGVMDRVGDRMYFELYGESFDPPIDDLTARWPG